MAKMLNAAPGVLSGERSGLSWGVLGAKWATSWSKTKGVMARSARSPLWFALF